MIAALFSLLTVALASPASDPDAMTGAWSISGASSQECRFIQTGASFHGTCVSPTERSTVTGEMDGNHVHWSLYWVSNADNQTGSSDYVGIMDDEGQITGTMTGGLAGASSFTAKRDSAFAF